MRHKLCLSVKMFTGHCMLKSGQKSQVISVSENVFMTFNRKSNT